MHRLWQALLLLHKQKPFLIRCTLLATTLHITLLLSPHFRKSPPPPSPHKLIVKTIIATEAPQGATTTTYVPKPAATPKKVLEKKSSPPKPTPSKAPPPSKPSKTKKLLTELQKNIASMEEKREPTKPATTITVPKPIQALKADSYAIETESEEKDAVSYQELLVAYLKDSLHLPGYGTVKIKLTLESHGVLQDLIILSSDSEVNRLYLENALQELTFPLFSEELSHQKMHNFVLTFCSDQ